MEVFEVESREFASRPSFNQYLADHYGELTDRDLYILTGLTEYDRETFDEVLAENHYHVIDDLGAVQKMERRYGDGKRIQFYLSFDEESGIFLCYTDMRKTEEIENTLEKFLRETRGVHYLFVSPRVLQTIREEIVEGEPAAQITEFVAKRTDRTDTASTYRPEFARTINYYGDDGLDTLREMERNYGVLPRIMEFDIPSGLQFRVNREGMFKFLSGNLLDLFEYIQLCISEALKVKEAYEEADFQMVPVSDQLDVPTSEPVAITLHNSLQYHEVDDLKQSLGNHKYVVIDSYAEEGSLYFSTKLIDETKNSVFSIKANEDEIRVFPQDRKDLGSFYRFYEFIQDSIDERAELAQA
ncbi:hypothetical protein [Halomarina ordinaria]|uniref:Uncharacterized protein n=1 Tax=Halomarina ordinaria TaxID=3033939 RepID=A0ABD5UD12_9EURY|nr:hypothetical protein [Halomarina sp. PSRA2]